MAKHMRTKNIIVCSYIFVMLAICVPISVLHLIHNARLFEINKLIANRALGNMAKENLIMADGYLDSAAKNFLRVHAFEKVYQLSSMLDRQAITPEQLIKHRKIRRDSLERIKYQGRNIGYYSIITHDGKVLLCPNKHVMNHDLKQVENEFPNLYKLFSDGVKKGYAEGYYRFYSIDDDSIERKYQVMIKIPHHPYFVAATCRIDVFMNQLRQRVEKIEDKQIAELNAGIDRTFREGRRLFLLINAGIMLFTAAVAMLLGRVLAFRIARPLERLQAGVRKIGQGDYTAQVSETGSLEVVNLAKSFNHLGREIENHIKNLAAEVKNRQSFESEMKIAGQIQHEILPKASDDFIRPEFTIHGRLRGAKEVAGDFFDFYYHDETGILVMLIADVSGKGMPAALFMMMSKTIIRDICLNDEHPHPQTVLEQANNRLIENNQENMFLTAFLAFYHVDTGLMSYANAGHHATVRIEADGEYSNFGVNYEPGLGMFPGTKYTRGKINIDKGDTLLFFTDGIPEAKNNNGEFFGDDRLRELVLKNRRLPVGELTKVIVDEVGEFQNQVLFDDITVLAFRRETGDGKA